MEHLVRGPLLQDSALTVQAPAEFFDRLTGCLITEPVKLMRSTSTSRGQTFDRRSLQDWFRMYPGVDPLTGEVMGGWSIISSDNEMAAKLRSWADAHAFDLELITRAACAPKSPRTPPCIDVPSKPRNIPCAHCGLGASPSGSLASCDELDMPLEMCGRSLSLPKFLRT